MNKEDKLDHAYLMAYQAFNLASELKSIVLNMQEKLDDY